ncbi:hypothetical protein DM02DRAFT_230634 [Periconia macrospinosa]|uniref:Phorbol-ester/DAG-type domain-containing protein n=1 Tax=Periconia macrospinosa TaxID=97972 RepID=A0A2V1EB48_9PLEO|nr:hypothetical protein DM02DRAFT_230634 [Periconia macrospinosa]
MLTMSYRVLDAVRSIPTTTNQILQVMTTHNEHQKARSQSTIERRNEGSIFRSATAPISPPPLTRPRKKSTPNSLSNASSSMCELPNNMRATASEYPQQRLGHEIAQVGIIQHTRKHPSTCRACKKKITKAFDPLVPCRICGRPYHESCLRSMGAVNSTE